MGKWFWIFLAIVVLIAAIGFLLWWSNFGVSVSHYTVSSSKIPSGFNGYKIIQLSDLHSASIGRKNSRLLKAVRDEEPDIVVMTGDMVSRYDSDFDAAAALAKDLAEDFPIYYIRGNHEQGLEKEDRESYWTRLTQAGITILDNEAVSLKAENEDEIKLYGLWVNLNYYHQMASYYKPLTAETIRSIIGDAPESYSILLAHNPNHFKAYAEWGADLIFSGHIHGGMVRLPFIGGILSPETLLFPKYDAGSYKAGDSTMILSRGLGRGRMGIRVFNPPDVVSVVLHNTDE